MDKPKTPETLESENPCYNTPIEASGSSGTNQNGSGLASVSDMSDNLGFENVDVETQVVNDERIGDGGEVEDLAIFEEEKSCVNGGESEKGCLVSDGCLDNSEKEVKIDSFGSLSEKEENKADLGLLERQSVGSEDVETKERVQDKETGEENPSESNGIASSEGISLYVDISGSPSGFMKQEVDGDEEQGKSISSQSFSVGDIVWVQTKNQSWWPGKICDPVDAPKYAARSGKGAHLLVGYYGISHFAWCFPSQLKPFHENFEAMSGKNKARIFLGAVEKAVDEFGRRVKLEMTCSCDLRGNKQLADEASFDGGVLLSERQSGRLGEFSVTNFEPVLFLEHLKYLAEVISMPRALDFTVTQNRLSFFYSSIGHRQLPMHLLAEKDDTEEDTLSRPNMNGDQAEDKNVVQGNSRKNATNKGFVSRGSRKRKMKKASETEGEDNSDEAKDCFQDEMMEKGFDSRERKKSRYLSYPYINLEQKNAAEEEALKAPKVTPEPSMGVDPDIVSLAISKSNGEKFWKKWYRRFAGGTHMPSSSELKNAASAELLRKLLSAAVDGLRPNQNNEFTPVGWFFSRFRISAYYDESADEICPKNMTSQNEANDAEPCLSENTVWENKPKQKRTKKKENPMKHSQGELAICSPNVIGCTIPTGVEDLKEGVNLSSGKDSLMSVKKMGQTNSGKVKTKPLSGLSDVSISVAATGVSVKDAVEMGQPLPCNNAKQRKKKIGEEASIEHLQNEQINDIPDLNGSSAMPSFNDSQVVNHVASEGRPEHLMNSDANVINVASGLSDACGTNAKPGNLVVDLRVPQERSAGLNYSHTAALLDFVGNNVKPGFFEKDGQPFGIFSEQGKPTPKKRKRKGKKAAPVHIPDLNGTSGDFNLVGKEPLEANGVTPSVKPERKKRRKKMQVVLNYPRNPSFAKRPDMNAGYHRAEANGEALGTALLLTFAPGVAMPSREELVSAFKMFGPLKESETRVLTDPGSVQIAFVRSADASKALKSIEKNNPFGSPLVNFRLHQLLAPPKVPETSHAQASPQPPAAPPLDFIKQNLQMMTAMLEKSGDSLSLEMRTKLEGEIKGLLSKVSSMAGSCS